MKNGIGRLVLLFWLLVSSSSLLLSQCSQGKIVFVWVNGILVKDQPTWESSVGKISDKFFTSHPNLNRSCVIFYPVYNQSVNAYRDLLQSNYQVSMQDVDKYLNDLNLLNTAPQAHQSFMAAALGYQTDLQSSDPDMAVLDKVILDWWKKGYRVVLVGHSQGNFYINAAYNIRLRNADGKGKTLPNSNWLSVIGIASPANNVADGRQLYTTHCNDFIYYAPKNVGGKALQWNVRNNFVACLAASTANFVLNFFSAVGELIQTGYSIPSHLLGTYMSDNSSTQKQVYRHMEDSLPDPLCKSDSNCYLKDNFRAEDYTANWFQTNMQGLSTTTKQLFGILEFYTRGYFVGGGGAGSTVYAPGISTLRTRRVFTGSFTSNFFINHIGGGKSTVSLKKVVDNTVALALIVNNSPGQNYVSVYPSPASPVIMPTATGFGAWHNITFTKTDTTGALLVDGVQWTVNSLSAMDGYYLELDSQGDNTLQVKNLSVVRSAGGVSTTPFAISSLSCTPNPTDTNTEISCKLTGTGFITSSIQLAFFGGACDATLGCQIPLANINQISLSATNVDFTAKLLTSGIFTLKARNSSLETWVTAGTVNVASVSTPPTAFIETFSTPPNYQTNWTYTVGSGTPGITYTTGKLAVVAVNSASPGTSGLFVSKQTFTGDMDVTFKYRKGGFGSSNVGLMSNGAWLARLTIDTDDTAYVFYCNNATTCDGYLKYPSSPYLNRDLVVRIKTSATQVQFYIDGALMQTYSYIPPSTAYQLAFAVGSISWKSGSNMTDFYSIIANGLPVSAPAPKLTNVDASQLLGGQLTPVSATGTEFDTGATLQFSNSDVCADFVCTIPTGDIVSRSATSFFAKANLAAGSYSARIKNGDGQTSDIVAMVVSPTSATGSINVSVTGYSGSINCALNDSNITAPTTLANQPIGSYVLSCAPPNGYQVLSVTPSSSQTLSAGGVINFLVELAAAPSFTFTTLNSSKSVQAGNKVGFDLNLTPSNNFTGQVTVFVSGLPANTSIVNSSLVFSIGPTMGVSFTLDLQTTGGTPPGTYTLTLQAQGGGISQYLSPSLVVSSPTPAPLAVSCYLSLNPINLGTGTTLFANASGGSGSYLYSLNGGGYQSSNTQLYWPQDAGYYTYTATVKDSNNTVASTSCGVTVNGVAPSITNYTWDFQPVHGVNFSGYVYGNAFTPSSTVWFYGPGCSNGCQHPGAGVSVQQLTTIRLTNVNLGAGSYQVQVRTAYGSATSGYFTVN